MNRSSRPRKISKGTTLSVGQNVRLWSPCLPLERYTPGHLTPGLVESRLSNPAARGGQGTDQSIFGPPGRVRSKTSRESHHRFRCCDGVSLSDQQSFQNQAANEREFARSVQFSGEILDSKPVGTQSKLNGGSNSARECDSAPETTH